ncbi:hypothetical protein [Thiolapillus sp.]|uniref:hypothetical protein n=1 Tax=Thiolapillus sp. TaxID=2017437 RepID=UPI003AF97B10
MTRVIKYATWTAAVSLVLAGIAGSTGIRINTTVSIPRGIYITSGEPVETGAYVIFCPPDYFGPVDIGHIKSVIHPVITW